MKQGHYIYECDVYQVNFNNSRITLGESDKWHFCSVAGHVILYLIYSEVALLLV
jgi:hypothetical protein